MSDTDNFKFDLDEPIVRRENMPGCSTILLVILFAVVIYSAFIDIPIKDSKTPESTKVEKEIETRLQPIYQKTIMHETRANDNKVILGMLDSRFDSINALFEAYKQKRDTVRIFAYCDTMQFEFDKYRVTSKQIISDLDSAIINYKYIVLSKDTIIQVQKEDIDKLLKKQKKLKRQRNISLIANAVLAGLLIIK